MLFRSPLLLALFLLLPPAAVSGRNFSFAFLSDTHVGSSTGADDLRATVQDINSMTGLSFVVISGDITEYGSLEQLKLAKQLLGNLRLPCHLIPGNHDTKWSESGATDFSRLWGSDHFAFEFGGYCFIGMHVASGRQIWRTGDYVVRESIGMSQDQTRFYVRAMNDFFYAFSTTTATPELIWQRDGRFGYDINSAMLVEKDGVVFYGTKNGLVFALDARTGAICWEHKLGAGIVNTLVPLSATQVLATDCGGKIALLSCKLN